jgi:hypothetical protein
VHSRARGAGDEKVRNVSISIACITNKNEEIQDIYELSKLAASLKKECKEIEGSSYTIC